jgi:hypothetical protein
LQACKRYAYLVWAHSTGRHPGYGGDITGRPPGRENSDFLSQNRAIFQEEKIQKLKNEIQTVKRQYAQ